MQPKWKFRDVPDAPNIPRPFYVRPLPDELPAKCGICGTAFRHGFNLTIGPGRAGRFLRKAAYYGFLPCILLAFVMAELIPETYSRRLNANHAWWTFFGTMFVPPMLLGGLSVILPTTRLVECKKCGWNRDYRISKPQVP